MFESEMTRFKGKFYTFEEIINKPRPVQKPRPAIMIGGQGEKRTFKIAAKYADIVQIVFNLPLEVLKRKIAALKDHCKKVGSDFSEITLSVGFMWYHHNLENIMKNY